jgi:hypothetical protein
MVTASIVNVVFYGYRDGRRKLLPKNNLLLGVDDVNFDRLLAFVVPD